METISNAIVKRDTYIQRFATHIINSQVRLTSNKFARELPELINTFDADGADLSMPERRQVVKLVNDAFKSSWVDMWGLVTEELNGMAILDVEHVAGVYDDLTGVAMTLPADAAVVSATKNAVMVLTSGDSSQADVWPGYVKRNVDTATRAITGQIWAGYNAEIPLTNQQIVRNIRGTYNKRTKSFQGGVLNGMVKSQAEALVRTGVSHFANSARDRMYQQNKEHLETRIFYAVMDNRVSKICSKLHLSEYPTESNDYPRIPRHFNCRSVWISRVKGFDPLAGTRPSIGGEAGADEDAFKNRPRYRGRKDTDIYDIQQVPADLTMDAFFRRQPRAWVESNLGKSRAKLFLDGGMELSDFTNVSGKTLNLDELREVGNNDTKFRKASVKIS